ncbi:MAG: hypothetical protein LBL01_04730, partial [Bifidobacteriaceae bacterium]|nr:hypothetical protein [Bifidobacteriaceae bacterium]
TLFAYRDDLPDHALRLQVDRESSSILTAVVAGAPTTGGADLAAEEATCDDLANLSEALWRRGVEASRVAELPAGAVQVERDERARRPARAAGISAAAARPLERERAPRK